MSLDLATVKHDRPERLERADVLAIPAGGSMMDRSWLPPHLHDPLTLQFDNGLRYLRWDDGMGDVAFWREDIALERFFFE